MLTPGQLADFVVLDQDLLSVDRDGIGEVSVDATVVGGEIAFDRIGMA